MKDQILKLRAEGKTYNEIVKILGCSKGTVAYHCGSGQKEKTRKRASNYRKGIKSTRKPKPLKNCLNCDTVIEGGGKKYCCGKCQQDHQYKIYIEAWRKGEESGARAHEFRVSNYVRRHLFEIHDGKCPRCGWNTPNPIAGNVILEIEHLDGDCTNNRPENLDLICPNCHSLTPTYKALNSGNGNRDRLKYSKLI